MSERSIRLSLNEAKDRHYKEKMFLVIYFSDLEATTIQSFASVVFTVVPEGTDAVAQKALRRRLDDPNDPHRLGGYTHLFENPPWSTDGQIATEFPTRPALPSGTNDPSSLNGTIDGPTTDSGGGGGGLSTSAKAGIGAACGVAGLILISLAIFFFLRRRRRREAKAERSLPFDADPSTVHASPNDYLIDKETHARVADTPNSDDDGGGPLVMGGENVPFHPGAGPGPGTSPTHATAVAVATAVASAAAVPPAASASPVAGAVPTLPAGTSAQDLSPRVDTPRRGPDVPAAIAHLVEEGMTEEEIRRLEEEERALDQAIEQAAAARR